MNEGSWLYLILAGLCLWIGITETSDPYGSSGAGGFFLVCGIALVLAPLVHAEIENSKKPEPEIVSIQNVVELPKYFPAGRTHIQLDQIQSIVQHAGESFWVEVICTNVKYEMPEPHASRLLDMLGIERISAGTSTWTKTIQIEA